MRSIGPGEIEKFIMEHHPRQEWKNISTLRPWVNWMMSRGCIDAFTDDGKELSLVLCSRMTNEAGAGQDFDIDPEGNCLAIDLIVAKKRQNKAQLSAVGDYLKSKHGLPKSVYWRRRDSDPKTIPAKNLAARLGLIVQ